MAERDGSAIGSTTPGHYGAGGSGVTLAAATIAAAWNVHGDPARPEFLAAVRAAFGVVLPRAPNTVARGEAPTALWLGPRSWLLVAGGSAAPLVDYVAKRDVVNGAGGALFDVSAGRVAWTVAGPQAAALLAKGCPLDFHPRTFAAGTCAQSVFGHLNVLLDKRDDTPTFTVLAARSYARELWHALCEAAAPHGYEVLPPGAFA